MRLKLSLLYFTYRPGGFDMLVNSLKTQTYENYELIVVDDLPNRDLTDYIEDSGIPLTFYGPSKEKHYPDTAFNSANAVNTGILEATGDTVIFLEDYAWLRPGSLDRWNHILTEKGWDTLISAVGAYWKYKPPERIGDITVWNEPFTGDFSSCTHLGTWRPVEWEFFYGAVSMQVLEILNGLDELLDYHNQLPCLTWPSICKAAGFNFYVDDEHIIDLIDHRKWSTGEKRWWWTNYTATSPIPAPEDLPTEWAIPAPNAFNLQELNKEKRKQIHFMEWAAYSYLHKENYFLVTEALLDIEREIETMGGERRTDALFYCRRFEYPWAYLQFPPDAELVLDAGGGPSSFQYLLARNFPKVWNIDKNAQWVEEVEEIIKLTGKFDNLVVKPGNLMNLLDIPDNTFDTTTCISVIEHDGENAMGIIGELMRVTKGPVLITMDIGADADELLEEEQLARIAKKYGFRVPSKPVTCYNCRTGEKKPFNVACIRLWGGNTGRL